MAHEQPLTQCMCVLDRKPHGLFLETHAQQISLHDHTAVSNTAAAASTTDVPVVISDIVHFVRHGLSCCVVGGEC